MGSNRQPAGLHFTAPIWVQAYLSQNQLLRAPTRKGLNKPMGWNNFLGTHLEQSNEKSD
jgi:hypothetical protein